MKIINPSNEQVITEVEVDTPEQINSKFTLLKSKQNEWKKVKIDDRLQYLQNFCNLLKKNSEYHAKILTAEVGKPLQESHNEINGAIKRINFFIKHAKEIINIEKLNQDGNTEEVLDYDPLGVIGYISAWNYPYLIFTNVAIAALAAGNSVLYKPSELATMTGTETTNLLHEAGFPPFSFQMVIGGKEVGDQLTNLPLDGFFFTGSYKTGNLIYQKLAPKMIPCGLELGGKDPLYVTDEIDDIKTAAENAVEGAFYNNGQSCCAVERIYVHQKIYSQFLEHFVLKVRTLLTGDPMNPETTQGPVTRFENLNTLKEQVEEAEIKGAKLEIGGKIMSGLGFYFEPTVLSNVDHTMSIMKDESFGPVIGIQKVQSDGEAIKLMNDTEYGLTAAVFSKNISRAKNILKEVNSGTSYVNCCDRVSPYLPWSGRKHSGLGSTLSKIGLLSSVKPRGWHIRF